MDVLEFLPIVLYLLGITLLVILIILGIKLIHTVDKTNEILEDAYNKTKSLDGVFDVIDKFTDTVSNINDSVVGIVSGIVSKIVNRKKNKEEEEENE